MSMPGQPLLIVGLGAWAGVVLGWAAYLAPLAPWGWAAAGLILLAAALCCAALWRVATAALVLVMLGALAGSASAAGHLAATRPPWVQEWARQGQAVDVIGVVQSVRVVAPSDGGRPYARATIAVRSIGPSRAQRAATGRAALIGNPFDVGQLDRGSPVKARGRLLPIEPWREPGVAVAVSRLTATGPPSGFPGFVASSRERMWHSLAGIDPDAASLVAGLAIGDDSRQSDALAQAMRDSGLSHLTAVSGGNIAIVAGLVLGGSALAGAGLRLRIGAAFAAVTGYAAFVGPEPSVLRAAVMGAVATVGLLRTTRTGGFPLLGLAVLSLVVLQPGLALSWGFALSVCATAGILQLGPRLEAAISHRAPGAPGALIAALAVTLAAQAATAPVLAAMTGTLSLIGIPANLLAAPLVAPMTVLGLALVVVSTALPAAGGLVARLVEPFGMLLARLAEESAGVPYGTLPVPAGLPGGLLVVGVGCGLAAVYRGVARSPPR